jgi:hypothetical protein
VRPTREALRVGVLRIIEGWAGRAGEVPAVEEVNDLKVRLNAYCSHMSSAITTSIDHEQALKSAEAFTVFSAWLR